MAGRNLSRETQGLQGHERVDLLAATTIPFNIKRAHYKASESGCLFRFSLRPFDYETVS
jgi:hypothetical protein